MDSEMKEFAERFGKSLRLIFQRIRNDFKETSDTGLTPPQFHILVMISEVGPCKVTTLAELMDVKPSAITVMIDRLVGQELVKRHNQENDRRVVLLSITDKGLQILERLKQTNNEMIGGYFSRSNKKDIEHMVITLEKISSDLTIQESGKTKDGK